MVSAHSSTDRYVSSNGSVMENTDATSLNNANEVEPRDGAYGVYNTTPFMSDAKSETIVIKPQGKKDGK